MLGETSTKQIAKSRDARGFNENQKAAKASGTIAGGARKELEKQTGHSVVTTRNNLASLPPSEDLLELPEHYEEAVRTFSEAKLAGKKASPSSN